MTTAEPTERYGFTKISVPEAARRLQMSESSIRRAMKADYEALAVDENAPCKFKFGRILKGFAGDNIYMINGDAIDQWLESFARQAGVLHGEQE